MPTVEFSGDDRPALKYIKERGYASYSSIKNVRDCIVPSYSDEIWFKFGKELHSRYLEGKKLETLSDDEEDKLARMLLALRAHPVAKKLTEKSQNEIDYGPAVALKKYKSKNGILVPTVHGLPIYGRIDILNATNVADLKTTKITNMKAFVDSLDFLQASIYLAATGRKDFFYIGICKQNPFPLMIFNVRQYPDRLAAAEMELRKLCKYIKNKL